MITICFIRQTMTPQFSNKSLGHSSWIQIRLCPQRGSRDKQTCRNAPVRGGGRRAKKTTLGHHYPLSGWRQPETSHPPEANTPPPFLHPKE